MPTPALSTVQHRKDLDEIAGAVADQVRAATIGVDTANIDRWWDTRRATVTGIIVAGNREAQSAAGRYLLAHAAGAGVAINPVFPTVDLNQIETSLRVTGPVAFKKHMSLTGSPTSAAQTMRRRLTGSAERQALAGARSTVAETITRARLIVGWQRITAAGACKFCEMLAGRGAVYKSSASAAGVVGGRGGFPRGTRQIGRSFHDHCRCTVEPLYDTDPVLVAREPTEFERRERERARARSGRLRRRANIARARSAHETKLAAERRAAIGRSKVPAELLERYGVNETQFLNARATVKTIKSDIREAAQREADNLAAFMSDNSLDQITRPERLQRRVDVISGRARSVRSGELGNYDFIEQLDDAELRRVRNRFVDADIHKPDLLAQRVRDITNTDYTDDEAMDWLVDRWLHEDGLRSVASGRIPKYADPDNLIPADYALEGYRLDRLFGVDVDDAAGHVAQIQKEAGERYAERVLGNPTIGRPPWEMTADDFVRELELLEDVITNAPPGIVDDGVAQAERRLRELIPADLELAEDANAYEIYETIRITAQTAGRIE